MRRRALLVALVALVVAGCGTAKVVAPLPQTVEGPLSPPKAPKGNAAAGKAVFVSQGCGACHTYTPAGPDAKGTIGPDLDKLAAYAKGAKQPLAKFVHDSIVSPDKYIQKGYPKGVMPKSYKSLPANDLKALVDFLTKPQG